MAKSTPGSGGRKSPATKSRPAKRAVSPRATSRPRPGVARQPLNPVDKAAPDALLAPVPLIAEINLPADEPEPSVPIKEWTMWGSIRQLIGGWAK
jgi:hypothetical protein